MSLVYTPFKGDILRGAASHNMAEAGADARILLAMTNTTFDTEQDDEFVGDTTTPDEYDGAAYVRKSIGSQTVTDAAPPLVAWIDTGGFPFSGNGGNVDVAWNAEGIVQAT